MRPPQLGSCSRYTRSGLRRCTRGVQEYPRMRSLCSWCFLSSSYYLAVLSSASYVASFFFFNSSSCSWRISEPCFSTSSSRCSASSPADDREDAREHDTDPFLRLPIVGPLMSISHKKAHGQVSLRSQPSHMKENATRKLGENTLSKAVVDSNCRNGLGPCSNLCGGTICPPFCACSAHLFS